MKTIFQKFRLYLINLSVGVLIIGSFNREQAFAQTFTAEVNKDTITLGEPALLVIRLSSINPRDLSLLNGVDYNKFETRFAIIQSANPDTALLTDGTYEIRQSIKFTSFDTGKTTIPEFKVLWNDSSRETPPTPVIPMVILPVDVSSLDDFHETTEILTMETHHSYWVYGLLVLSVILIVFLLGRLLRKRNTPDSPYLTAINSLKSIKNSPNIDCHKLYTLIRNFYCEKFEDPRILNYSTREWSSAIQEKMPENCNEIIGFLHTLDSIRFGNNNSFASGNLKLEAEEVLNKIQSVKVEH